MSKNITLYIKYTEAKIYVAKDVSGNPIDRPWYVYYTYKHPKSGAMVMRKKTAGINRVKDLKLRFKKAKLLCQAINNELGRGFNPFPEFDEKPKSLVSCIDAYKEIHLRKLRDRTFSTVKSHLNHLVSYFNQIKEPDPLVEDITKENIINAINYCYKVKKWSNHQYNNVLGRWRGFFNWLIANERMADKNPCNRVPFLKTYPTDATRPPTEAEFIIIVNHLYKTDKALFLYAMIIYYEGFRVTETGMLQRKHIEFNTENPFFRIAAKDQKDNEDVIHYVSPHLLPYFYDAGWDKLPAEAYLFSTKLLPGLKRLKKIKDAAEERWKDIVKEQLAIKVNLYSMKHKQASELSVDVSDKDISRFLRHSSEEVTRAYMRTRRPIVKLEFFKNQRPLPLIKN